MGEWFKKNHRLTNLSFVIEYAASSHFLCLLSKQIDRLNTIEDFGIFICSIFPFGKSHGIPRYFEKMIGKLFQNLYDRMCKALENFKRVNAETSFAFETYRLYQGYVM